MQFEKENRLAYLNFLRAKYEAWTGEVLVRSYPSYLGIDPTSLCQLRCPHCPTGVENEARKSGQPVSFRDRTMLADDVLDALLDEVGEYLFLIMFYNWGEPLLNKNLPSLIKKAKPWNIYTEIHSNLSLRLTDQRIEELLNSGIDTLSASIDGFSQKTYETYRRGGDFELARTNLDRLVKIRDTLGLKTRLVWGFLVFSFNEHELEVARSYCEERGIIFNPREAYTTNPDWLPSYRKGKLISAAVQAPAPGPEPPSQPAALSPCAWHYSYTMVNANGSVSPCCASWEQKHDFGTVVPGRVSFADIWNNNFYRKSRAAFANKDIKGLGQVDTLCLRCPFGQGVQQQYSGLDVNVINQFRRMPKGWDPLLEEAFGLLDDGAAFVRFFANNLSRDFSPTVPPPRNVAHPPDALAIFGPRRGNRAAALLKQAARRLRSAALALTSRQGRSRRAAPARGDRKECNICGWRGKAFEGGAHSESAVCPSCNSISRDRFLYYCFTHRAQPHREMRVLETSPRLGGAYRRRMKKRFDYLCSDFDEHAHRGDLHVDLQAIDLPSESLDIVLTPHVLEHVPDTDKALAELRRVLRPGGRMFLQVPLLQGKTSVPAEPEYHGDHTLVYWRFGWDLTDKIRSHGFDCTVLVLEDLRRRCVEGRSDWEARSPEFDIESIVSSAWPGDLTAVADERAAGRHGFEPSYMFVTWECTKQPVAVSRAG
jgi:MoaA/NifB/PqqE/SkfB family radical SAM enzyme/SAM-dependent methyltransferase